MHDILEHEATILMVDQDEAVLGNLTEILSLAGYECHATSDAKLSIDLARRVQPNLLILCISLAERNGMDLWDQIRRESGLASLPAMFLSSSQVPDIIRRSHAAGGAYFVRKPFDPQVMLELIDQALWVPRLSSGSLAVL